MRRDGARLVDSAETREHLRRLSRAGIGSRQVELISGVKRSVIQNAKSGRTKNLRVVNSEAILAVTLHDHVSDKALVDARMSHRLIREMHKHGIRCVDIARVMGYANGKLQQTWRKRITHRNAKRILLVHQIAMREIATGKDVIA
jgi:predicted chitinase